MQKGVLLIGAIHNEKMRILLRRNQMEIANTGALVKSLLDFAKEGEDMPDERSKIEVIRFLGTSTKQVVVGIPDADWCHWIMDLAKDAKIEIIDYRDINFEGPRNPFRKTIIEKLNEMLKPWFTNPMKYQNTEATPTHTSSFKS